MTDSTNQSGTGTGTGTGSSTGTGTGSGSGPESEERSGTGFWAIAQSVGAGLIGVQSKKNRERDFTQGKPIHFLVGGVIGTALFLVVVWLIVQYLLATS